MMRLLEYSRVLIVLAVIAVAASFATMIAGLAAGSWFGALGFDLVVTFSLVLATLIGVLAEDEMDAKLAASKPVDSEHTSPQKRQEWSEYKDKKAS